MPSAKQKSPDNTFEGWLDAYIEQGMEGFAEWSVYDKSYGGNKHGGWDQAGTVFFQDGDELTVFGRDGQPIWAGLIHKQEAGPGKAYDRTGHLGEVGLMWKERRYWPCCTWIPREVDGPTWVGWFYQRPRMSARLIRRR